MAASLAGLLFGFDTAVISGVTGALRSEFALSAVGLGTAVSAALIGTLVGALGAGAPGDRFGSRTVLVWIALLVDPDEDLAKAVSGDFGTRSRGTERQEHSLHS